MKFTKEEARKELMSKIPGKGQTLNLSERSINEQLDALMPLIADDEMELSAFIEKVLPIFKVADGNIKNDVSAGIKDYQNKNKQEPPKPNNKTDEPNPNDLENILLKKLEEMEKKIAATEQKTLLSQRRSEITSKMNEKGCKDNEWINELLNEVSLDGDDFDSEARVERYMKMYNKTQAKPKKDTSPDVPSNTDSDTHLNDLLKGIAEKNKANQAKE